MHSDELTIFYTYLSSEQTAQDYLLHCYQQINENNPEKKSYQNCHAFMYYLQHGIEFYQVGKSLQTQLKPILLFYGITHLLKAVLLTRRPDYPESTKVLAHGVSSRKRKKQHYQFIHDEVKVQYHGLFPYAAKHLFQHTTMPFEKISMHQLLSFIPELLPLFSLHKEQPLIQIGTKHIKQLTFPSSVLDDYHLTERSFLKKLTPHLPSIINTSSSKTSIEVTLSKPLRDERSPFFFHTDSSIHFPTNNDAFISIAEVLVHYLLLYNLSMISRYEAEWWGELLTIKPDIDYPLIELFLNVTAHKTPILIGEELMKNLK